MVLGYATTELIEEIIEGFDTGGSTVTGDDRYRKENTPAAMLASELDGRRSEREGRSKAQFYCRSTVTR